MAQILWRRATGLLASIYVLRMLGMFMIFPVFSLYALQLEGSTPELVGLALGIYGLSQGILQIPYGKLSDRFGRRPLMAIGLLLFVIGSAIAAVADSIGWMIAGRAIQGMGAISAVTLAYATDVVPIEKRGMVMAIIGGSIGMAFVLSLIIGPIIAQWIGVDGLFWLIAVMAAIGLMSIVFLPATNADNRVGAYEGEINRAALWQASFAVFILHGILSATFLVLPVMLVNSGLAKEVHWWLYLPANLIALAFIRYRVSPHPLNFAVSFILLALGLGLMACNLPIWGAGVAITVYFIAFYRLETGLPHWVANIADPESRGQAMGIYSTAQFAGSFVGAVGAGALWSSMNSGSAVLIALLCASGGAALILLFIGKKDTLARQ